eukprot:Lithocolla_globosa_v1_NODE_4130_length_1504_cov_17.396135.p2 type:complete len:129 gc:universal NODE_4130_length_1504_cov_17.396135:988-1374(+)
MAWKIGLTCSHASFVPPGMIEGPCRAPSSPPETPEPTKCKPCSEQRFSRRIVSGKWVLPPSIRMSPFSSLGMRRSMVASTAAPAFTINIIFLGFLQAKIISSMERRGTILVPLASFCIKASTFSTLRL